MQSKENMSKFYCIVRCCKYWHNVLKKEKEMEFQSDFPTNLPPNFANVNTLPSVKWIKKSRTLLLLKREFVSECLQPKKPVVFFQLCFFLKNDVSRESIFIEMMHSRLNFLKNFMKISGWYNCQLS